MLVKEEKTRKNVRKVTCMFGARKETEDDA